MSRAPPGPDAPSSDLAITASGERSRDEGDLASPDDAAHEREEPRRTKTPRTAHSDKPTEGSKRKRDERPQIWLRPCDLSSPAVAATLAVESPQAFMKRANNPGADRGHFCPQLLGLQGPLDSPIPSFIDEWGDPSRLPSVDTLACYIRRRSYGVTDPRVKIVRTCLGPSHVQQQLDEDADWIAEGLPSSCEYLIGWIDQCPLRGHPGTKVAWIFDKSFDTLLVYDGFPEDNDLETCDAECAWYEEVLDGLCTRLGVGPFRCYMDDGPVCLSNADPIASLPMTAYALHQLAADPWESWICPGLVWGECGYGKICQCGPQNLGSEWMMRLRTAQADYMKAGIGKETLRAILDSKKESEGMKDSL